VKPLQRLCGGVLGRVEEGQKTEQDQVRFCVLSVLPRSTLSEDVHYATELVHIVFKWQKSIVIRRLLRCPSTIPQRTQVCFQLRHVNTKPAMLAMIPPMSIQMALSVGDPVKNLDASEAKEFMALIPKIMSTTPNTSRAMETILFITTFQ
jgi:hypothetical protein